MSADDSSFDKNSASISLQNDDALSDSRTSLITPNQRNHYDSSQQINQPEIHSYSETTPMMADNLSDTSSTRRWHRLHSVLGPEIMSVQTRRNLKTLAGVFCPVALSQFSSALFLRLGFVVGQSGLLIGLLQFFLAYFILYLTVLSICAIATNGAIEGGGAYYMISRALGPEFGGSIGLLFFTAQVFSCAMYVSGSVEGLIDNFGVGGSMVAEGQGLPSGSHWWTYLYCTVVLAFCLSVGLIGGAMFARTSLAILVVVVGCTLTVIISMFVKGEMCVTYPKANKYAPMPENVTNATQPCANYTGLSGDSFMDNLYYGNFTIDYMTGKEMDFATVFAILFSSVTGIMNGANMSGELKEPHKSIPRGTLSAATFTLCTYIVLIFLISLTTTRDLLTGNYNFMQDVNVWPPFVVIGIFAATLSAALGNLIGGSRILEALANDELFWSLLKPAKWTTKNGNPLASVFITWFLVQVVLLIGSLNAIAPFTCELFLLAYAATNLTCFALDVASASNFRPTFRYFSWHTALLGLIGSLAMGFLVNWIYAFVAIVLFVIIAVLLHLRAVPAEWGSISQALIFHQVRKYLLMLDIRREHVKYWRPQMLLLVANPRSCAPLIDFINDVKKGGLYIVGHVHETAKSSSADNAGADVSQEETLKWLSLVDRLKVKAFVEVTTSSTGVRDGALHLVRLAGLGGMKPNTVCIGFYDDSAQQDLVQKVAPVSPRKRIRIYSEENASDDSAGGFPPLRTQDEAKRLSAQEYVQMLGDVFRLNKNLCLFRYFDLLNKQALFRAKGQQAYIDVWTIDFFCPETSCQLDNACLFMLQLACILHMVPGWKSSTRLRVLLCVDADDVEAIIMKDKLHSLLLQLRIIGEVKVIPWHHLRSGDGTAPPVSPSRGVTVSADDPPVENLQHAERLAPVPRYDLSDRYLNNVNCMIKSQSRNTAVVFLYLPVVPANNPLVYKKYLQQLDQLSSGLPPTVFVHGLHPVTSTTL